MARTVGIDLGTTHSVVAVLEGGEPVVIPNAEGSRTTPSVVAFTKNGERLVGAPARRQAIINPENTIYSIKRFMGRRFDEVESERKTVPYNVVAGKNGMAVVEVEGKQYAPEEISAMILQKLKSDAEAYLGDKVDKAVITVPAYFNDAQRQATRNAGQIAGLKVLRIISTPSAAALTYGLDRRGDETILVYDLGGGTFDVSVLNVGDGIIETRATGGDTYLGGDDWDQRVVDFVADSFQRVHHVDLRVLPQALQRLRDEAEKAKIALSASVTTHINLPFITADASGPKHLDETLTRAKFEELTRDLLERTRVPFEKALGDAGSKAGDLDEIVLVGGSTRMPMVVDLVKKLGGGKDPHRGVNPDEAVAVGAAIQGGMLVGEVKDLVLLDVTALTLGLEILGGVMDTVIERNTRFPSAASRVYTTAADGQTQVEIHVLQGEREMARDNKSLGRFFLAGIPPAPQGVPQIEVTFDIDANGILNVSAREKATGKQQSVTTTGSSTLDKADVERMVLNAQAHAAEDARRREETEQRNRAEQLVYQAEQHLKDLGEKVPGGVKNEVQVSLASLRGALEGGDVERIRIQMNTVQQALYRMSDAAYQRASEGTGAAEPAPGPPKADQAPPREAGKPTPAQARERSADPGERREANRPLNPSQSGPPQEGGQDLTLAIDFGTSRCVMAWLDPRTGQAEVLENAEGEFHTPSLVYWSGEDRLVGKPVEELLAEGVRNLPIIHGVKQDLQRRFRYPFLGNPTPVMAATEILRKLKQDAEALHFHAPLQRAILTHPVSFSELEKQRLEEAARDAGFTQVDLLEEPLAAALAFVRAGWKVGRSVLVYDLGAGTLDLALLARDERTGDYRTALPPRGLRCGGDTFDQLLYDHCDSVARRELGQSVDLGGELNLPFLRLCRSRKHNLSLPSSRPQEFSSLLESARGPSARFVHRLDQAAFERLIQQELDQTVALTRQLLDEARSAGLEVETLLLIGGSTRIPLVARRLEEAVGLQPLQWRKMDVAVALGAAYASHSAPIGR